jgi:putative transposase
MPDYRRLYIPGHSYFFTAATARRAPVLVQHRAVLRDAIAHVRKKHPFSIAAFVLLPDHLHTIWTLPPDDCNFPVRWQLIKSCVTRLAGHNIWQRRYWEHALRDEFDFQKHLDYIHWNPMKHGYVERVVDWRWSSFHRYRQAGLYPVDWCASRLIVEYERE